MSEYWKSIPKKFCEACKCWFADNKASVEFHERGRRHQENVKKRLDILRRKGQKEFKAKQKLNLQIQKIEREALKAFKKDVETNPQLVESCNAKVVSALASVTTSQPTGSVSSYAGIVERNKFIAKNAKGKKEKPKEATVATSLLFGTDTVLRTWYEAETEEKQTYYWNIETNDTSWETPIAFVSLVEQKEREAKKRLELSHKYAAQANPYGQWMPVNDTNNLDLQLPNASQDYYEEALTLEEFPVEEERTKFKEKTLQSSTMESDVAPVSFKKRKGLLSTKRSVRQRFEEDE